MTTGARTKPKPRQKLTTCTACKGAMVSVPVVTRNRYGEPGEGYESRHVECSDCDSTGKTRAKLALACCCSLPKSDARCSLPDGTGGCKNAGRGGSEVHTCYVPTLDELAFEQEMLFAPSPRAGAKTTAAAHALGNGVGERSGQRGNR